MLVVFFVTYLILKNESRKQISRERNSVSPTQHEFLLQGKDKIYINHFPMFYLEKHRHQLIIEVTLPQEAKTKYQDAKKNNPQEIFTLKTIEDLSLSELAAKRLPFKAVIQKGPQGRFVSSLTFYVLKT